jgi:hypothetical protein
MLGSTTVPGLRQGGAASPLLLNVYLHHLLDRPWRRLHSDVPLLRFADDILLLCRTRKRAVAAYRSLVEVLRPTGMALKEGQDEAIKVVARGDRVEWLGFGMADAGGRLEYTPTRAAWGRLVEAFALAHEKPNSPLRAIESLAGWVADKGPCDPSVDHPTAYARIARVAASQGFDEILDAHEVHRIWQAAHSLWSAVRAAA